MNNSFELFAALAGWTAVVGGFFAFLIRLMIKTALADFLLQLETTFSRSKEVDGRFKDLERRVAALESLHLRKEE